MYAGSFARSGIGLMCSWSFIICIHTMRVLRFTTYLVSLIILHDTINTFSQYLRVVFTSANGRVLQWDEIYPRAANAMFLPFWYIGLFDNLPRYFLRFLTQGLVHFDCELAMFFILLWVYWLISCNHGSKLQMQCRLCSIPRVFFRA